jgi:hypothetical protein
MEQGHIVLLGDSIFDNRAYSGDQPDVVGHLRSALPASWQASLCAVDGSMAVDLKAQLARIPEAASHIVVSVGGNDALMNADLLDLPVVSTKEALDLFGDRVDRFEVEYRRAIEGALALGRPITTCTIYNGNLAAVQASSARIALMLFNDVILRVAFELRLSLLDLRLVCADPSDYANPIEPSGPRGQKIAIAIARALGALSGNSPSRVFSG